MVDYYVDHEILWVLVQTISPYVRGIALMTSFPLIFTETGLGD